MIQILLVCTQKYAYVMVCFSTYIFSTSQEFVPTCPGGHGPRTEQDFDQVLYLTMDGRQLQNKHHGDTVAKKTREMFLCSLHINIKKARQVRFSTAGYMWTTRARKKFPPSCRGLFEVETVFKCGLTFNYRILRRTSWIQPIRLNLASNYGSV